jgi:retron-type reverse transcriptase
MAVIFNDKLLMWAIGVIQPATIDETISFLGLVYPQVKAWPDVNELKAIFVLWEKKKYIFLVNTKAEMYSLGVTANHYLGEKLRRRRDKARLSLLRSIYDASLNKPEEVVRNLGGVSPSSEVSLTIQEGPGPVNSGLRPSRINSTQPKTRIYWPRVAEQLKSQVGFDLHSSGTPIFNARYYSFTTLALLHSACPCTDQELSKDITTSQLAVAIGITPRLLTAITHNKDKHYRRFVIGKKGGGEREIASPRFFLKTIQYWIKTYVLWQLNIHDCCHAYMKGRSIVTNANVHAQQNFVANIDIMNFFGSISQQHVFNLMKKHNVGDNLASIVARLTTLDDSVPQGAPTSPQISNGVLFEFDKAVVAACNRLGLHYTRYADDITISGCERRHLVYLIDFCTRKLTEYNFVINESKTRISSKYSSQRVTGLVVNELVQPPREFRRKVRAMIYNAYKNPEEYVDRLDELRGYVSYLSSYESVNATGQLRKAKLAVAKVIYFKQKT